MALSQTVAFKDDSEGGGISRISLTLKAPAGFPEKYVKAVTRAMDGCAVKKHLDPSIPIETRVVLQD